MDEQHSGAWVEVLFLQQIPTGESHFPRVDGVEWDAEGFPKPMDKFNQFGGPFGIASMMVLRPDGKTSLRLNAVSL